MHYPVQCISQWIPVTFDGMIFSHLLAVMWRDLGLLWGILVARLIIPCCPLYTASRFCCENTVWGICTQYDNIFNRFYLKTMIVTRWSYAPCNQLDIVPPVPDDQFTLATRLFFFFFFFFFFFLLATGVVNEWSHLVCVTVALLIQTRPRESTSFVGWGDFRTPAHEEVSPPPPPPPPPEFSAEHCGLICCYTVVQLKVVRTIWPNTCH